MSEPNIDPMEIKFYKRTAYSCMVHRCFRAHKQSVRTGIVPRKDRCYSDPVQLQFLLQYAEHSFPAEVIDAKQLRSISEL